MQTNNEMVVVLPEDTGKWLIDNFHMKYYKDEWYIYKRTGYMQGYHKIGMSDLAKIVEDVSNLQVEGYKDEDITKDVSTFLEKLIR